MNRGMRDAAAEPALVGSLGAGVLALVGGLPVAVGVGACIVGALQAGRSVRYPPTSFSLQSVLGVLQSPTWQERAATSLSIAAASAALALTFGVLVSCGLRGGSTFVRSLVVSVLLAPPLVPPLLLVVGWYEPLHAVRLFDTKLGLTLLHAALALPLATLPVLHGLERLPRAFWLAAANCGASPGRALVGLALPALWRNVATGGLLALLASVNEVPLSLYLTQLNVETLARGLWTGVRFEFSPEVFAAALLLLAIDVALLAVTALISRSWRESDVSHIHVGSTPEPF